MWHSLDRYGNISVYDVEWSNGSIETNIPAVMLEGVKMKEHGHAIEHDHISVDKRKYKK